MTDDVQARWKQGLAQAASRAYEAAHGHPYPDQARGVRWRLTRRAGVIAAAVVVGVALVAWTTTPPPQVVPVEPVERESALVSSTVWVHVAGHVVAPGLVELNSGERVAQAIDAAGGFAAEADIHGVNLARVVIDGEQIYVGAEGDQAVAGGGMVNLNRAGAAELESLPGIGPALAARIVADRDANGPFRSVDDLTRVSGVGPAVVSGLHGLAAV